MILSQTITLTPEQIKKRNEIFTAEKIIDISKAIDNEKRQYEVIIDLQNKIDELKAIAKKKDSLVVAFSNENKILLKKLSEVRGDIDQNNEDILDQVKKPFLGLHSRAGLKVQEFDYKKINFYLNLSYDFKFLSLGLYGETFSMQMDPNKYQTEVNYGLFIEYKIF